MRVLLHDYGGYSFSVQLSRKLAERGHELLHLYGESTQAVKRGKLNLIDRDPNNLCLEGISLSKPFQKHSLLKRKFQEIEYGKLLNSKILEFKPDVVISANTPLDAQALAIQSSRKLGAQFIFWLQDVIGLATYKILMRKSPLLGVTVGFYYLWLERHLLSQSDKVIPITSDFLPLLEEWGISNRKVFVNQNWAVLDEIPLHPKRNRWAKKNGLENKFVFLYAGILGMKHNPELLLQLALNWRNNNEVCIVVVSQGSGAEWLKKRGEEYNLSNLRVLNFQPLEDFSQVLATSDVLIAILSIDAGVFSVPSKVLTYLCAKRPLLLSVPSENLAAKIVDQSQSGLVTSPLDFSAFLQASDVLYHEEELRSRLARNARKYAVENFEIEKITDRFEEIFLKN